MIIDKLNDKYFFFEIKNKNNMILKLTNIGASIAGVFFNDKNNNQIQVSFGSDDINFYLNPHDYIGASVGIVANRIINAEFEIENKKYTLSKNDNNKHHLHGGVDGISNKIFDYKKINENSILFTYLSEKGEYPANINISIEYTLTDENDIIIKYNAKADSKTPINLTNHAYWNLNGEGNIYSHNIFIDANYFLPTTNEYVPNGEVLKTKNTEFDFTIKKDLKNIENKDLYDHCFIFESSNINKLRASAYSSITGITLELYTTKPAMHFYTGNFLDNREVRNTILNKHNAFCFETEYLPASVNFNHFPSIIFDEKKEYNEITIYKLKI